MKTISDPPLKPESVVTFKLSHFYAVLVVLAFAAGLLVGYIAWGRNVSDRAVVVQPSGEVEDAIPAPTQAVKRYDIPTQGFPSIGPADAPITIVEFSDYQCPYCKRWHDEVYEDLMKAYPDQIRLVIRNLPLGFHPEALPAAQAAMCAGEQDAYWAFHDALFGDSPLGRETYLKYAANLGLDMEAFQQCLSEERYKEFIEKDAAFAENLGVNGTPTFFINGLAIVGAQPLEIFKNVIDKELAGEIP